MILEPSTQFLAQLIGVASVAIGLSMLLRRKLVMHIIEDILKSRSVLYLVGVAEFVAGLLLVLYHTQWQPAVAAVITILGWLMVIEGAVYMFVPRRVFRELLEVVRKRWVFVLVSAAYLLLGAYLVQAGFGL